MVALHKILGTKTLLFKMSIENNNVCRNCELAEETIEHLFFYCVKVKKFLSELYSCIRALNWGGPIEEVPFIYKGNHTVVCKFGRANMAETKCLFQSPHQHFMHVVWQLHWKYVFGVFLFIKVNRLWCVHHLEGQIWHSETSNALSF